MRKLIEPDGIEEPVRRFFDGLEVSSEPSVVEIGGRRVYIVVSPSDESETAMPWDDARAGRRHELIDRRLDATLTPGEAVELARLNEAFDRYLQAVAPLPLAGARKLLARLLPLPPR